MNFFDFFKKKVPPLVQQSIDDLDLMLATARDMFDAASAYLLENEPLAVDLGEQDEIINDKEGAIREALLHHFTINPSDDMVFSLMLISIVQDAERIGDLTKTLAKTAALAHEPRTSAHAAQLRLIRDDVRTQFDATRNGFVESNLETAYQVMETHRTIKLSIGDFIHSLANEKHVTINEGIVLAMGARMIGRIDSHLSNIVSTVVLPFDQIRRTPTEASHQSWEDDED